MPRRIFISYQHEDQMKAKGFNLLRWNKNVAVEFVGRHLLDPVDSENPAYIRSKIQEQLSGTSVTVVLIGKQTAESRWVQNEIAWSIEKKNGLLGIRLEPDVAVPAALTQAGAEIIDWDVHAFGDAIERATISVRRAAQIAAIRDEDVVNCGRDDV